MFNVRISFKGVTFKILCDPKKGLKSFKNDVKREAALVGSYFKLIFQGKELLDPSILKENDLLELEQYERKSFLNPESFEKCPQIQDAIKTGDFEAELKNISENPDSIKDQLKAADINMVRAHHIPDGIKQVSGLYEQTNFLTKTVEKPLNLAQINSDDIFPFSNEVNPLVAYFDQLTKLNEFGFVNIETNIDILNKVDGDLDQAMLELAKSNE